MVALTNQIAGLTKTEQSKLWKVPHLFYLAISNLQIVHLLSIFSFFCIKRRYLHYLQYKSVSCFRFHSSAISNWGIEQPSRTNKLHLTMGFVYHENGYTSTSINCFVLGLYIRVLYMLWFIYICVILNVVTLSISHIGLFRDLRILFTKLVCI